MPIHNIMTLCKEPVSVGLLAFIHTIEKTGVGLAGCQQLQSIVCSVLSTVNQTKDCFLQSTHTILWHCLK